MNFEELKIWSVTDGSKGMISQANGLAKKFGNNIIEIKTDLRFPWSKMQPGFLPIFDWIFKNNVPTKDLPDLIISCGRKSVYFSLYFKKKFKKIINIHIQNPRTSSKKFNFIVSPNHDKLYGNNIINSIGALHHFDKPNNPSNQELLSCIIGGDNQHYSFKINEINKLCDKLLEINTNHPEIKIIIITSRRTTPIIKEVLIEKLENVATIWIGNGENPYQHAIQNSSYFIVTSDSTSMISESAISGKSIYVYNLPFKRKSKRIINFHEEFNKLGITRSINNIKYLQKWKYDPLNESERIASIIKKEL